MNLIDLKGIEIIAIGGSAGGIKAVTEILKSLPKDFPIPIVIVLHRLRNVSSSLQKVIQHSTGLRVKEADEKETIAPYCAYIAPANYHLLIENDKTFSLDYSETVKYSRPSLDLTFECVAEIYGKTAIGILLTGANDDGANGLLRMRNAGAKCYVQDPNTAHAKVMPRAAIGLGAADIVVQLEEIGPMFSKALADVHR
ncbi:MAG: chemotaxis protein CheB [Flavobacteriales bacterium]|nr:chemotaxis protein CheB [Flavobacteriales bacterium]